MSKKRILVSPNSFKGCADSVTIAELIGENLSGLKNIEIIIKPISDGGDGFLNVCRFYFGGEIITFPVTTAFDSSVFECPVLYNEKRKVIYIESAEVLGLKIVPQFYRNPLKLTSRGLGELLMIIEDNIRNQKIKANKVFIGIGGTATIDMGIGMMAELGLKLFDSNGNEIDMLPGNFHLVDSMEYIGQEFSFELIPIMDVNNPLLGPNGGVKVFGSQKNANEKIIAMLEESFNNLLKLFENNGLSISSKILSGAGGGIPAAFQIFFNTQLLTASEFIEYYLGIHKYSDLEIVEYLITGEGAFDQQSGFEKGVGILLHLFRSNVKQIFLVCGKIDDVSVLELPKYVIPIELIKYFSFEYDSLVNYKDGIKKACQDIAKHLNF